MLDLWHRIKREREQQQFSATRAKLQVQLLDEPEDLADELEQEISERRLLHVLNTARNAGGPAAREAPFDEAQARAAIAERQVALRRAPDERTLVPVYTEESPASDYVLLPLDERRRLEAASRVELYAVLLVDGRVVGQTESTLIHPLDFCCRFNTCVQLQMLQAPRTLSLQLWQRKWSGFADSLLSEVFLAVPAAASGGVKGPKQERNVHALTVLRRMKCKLDGKDRWPGKERETRQTVAEQVETVIKLAVSPDNLCQMYEGWSAWV
jgi:hypothetical protein